MIEVFNHYNLFFFCFVFVTPSVCSWDIDKNADPDQNRRRLLNVVSDLGYVNTPTPQTTLFILLRKQKYIHPKL